MKRALLFIGIVFLLFSSAYSDGLVDKSAPELIPFRKGDR
jgi:hypothetical protein